MSKESVCTKNTIQPCIMSLLSPSVEPVELNVTTDNVEVTFQSVKQRKQKRSRKSGDQMDNKPNKKTLTKTPEKMSDSEPNQQETVGKGSVELSPELKELEKQLNTSMLININKCIAEALKPIKDSIEKIVNSSAKIDHQDTEIKCLSTENATLKSQVTELQNDVNSIKSKLHQLENKSLENNLIFKGIGECHNETEDALKDSIHQCIADTFNFHDEHIRLSAARSCAIRKCKRLGRPNPHRPRPISVEFENRRDADAILEFKHYLAKGVFLDKEYCVERERKRRILRS